MAVVFWFDVRSIERWEGLCRSGNAFQHLIVVLHLPAFCIYEILDMVREGITGEYVGEWEAPDQWLLYAAAFLQWLMIVYPVCLTVFRRTRTRLIVSTLVVSAAVLSSAIFEIICMKWR